MPATLRSDSVSALKVPVSVPGSNGSGDARTRGQRPRTAASRCFPRVWLGLGLSACAGSTLPHQSRVSDSPLQCGSQRMTP
jgi:hypothetical protein